MKATPMIHLHLQNFPGHVESACANLRNDAYLSDVTLRCEDKMLSAHKVILSASSRVFSSLLTQSEEEVPVIHMSGFKCEDVVNMLLYMYRGHVSIPANQLQTFTEFVRQLGIRGLSRDQSETEGGRSCGSSQLNGNLVCDIESIENIDNKKDELLADVDCQEKEENNSEKNGIDKYEKLCILDRGPSKGELTANHVNSFMLVDSEKKNTFKAQLSKKDRKFKCDNCDKLFINKSSATRHNKVSHLGESPTSCYTVLKYQCDLCDYKSSHKIHFKEHVEREHEGVLHHCELCSYKARDRRNLRTHMQSKHEGVRYFCDQCNYTGSQKNHITTHKKAIHDGVLFYCDQCDHCSSTQSNLNVHIESKHRRISHYCDRCDYRASFKTLLKKHIEIKHEGLRFYCDQCEYQATTKWHLKRHVQSKHDGVRFSCNHCSFNASQKNDLKRHMNKIHKMQTF